MISGTATAATIVDTLDFSTHPIAVTDSQSGNGIDYRYRHIFGSFDPTAFKIDSATLSLTHQGNLDTGPTQEIWYALSGLGTFLGRLGPSETKKITDIWGLPVSVLLEIGELNPWQLEIDFSEQTSFNGEKFDLYRSELEIRYSPKQEIPAAMPEPSQLLLCACGWLTARLRRKC